MRRVRSGLGVTSFGMQVIELPPNFVIYPKHDHSHDEQEEVYVALSGSATLKVEGEEPRSSPASSPVSDQARSGSSSPADEGRDCSVSADCPGWAYEPPEWTEEGAVAPKMPEKDPV